MTQEDLRTRTLRRQCPRIRGRGRGPSAVLELSNRPGPIQSHVPRVAQLDDRLVRLTGADGAS